VFIPPLRASLTRDGEFDISLFARRGMRLLDPLFLVRALPNAGVCGISVEHQVLGPNTNLTNGSTGGLGAVALATAAIARGGLDCAVAGGYDTLLTLDSIAEQFVAGRLSRHGGDPALACKPFDLHRDGLVVGEGAAFVVLEARRHAEARGARIYAAVDGVGEATDVGQLRSGAAPDGTGLHMAASMGLRQAGRSPADLGAVFGDGLGTVRDDLREGHAVRLLGAPEAPVTAATSAIGFTGAASGMFSLVHAALALHDGVAPPLVNCTEPDPECAVPFLTAPEPLRKDAAIVWNSDRGVKNVAVVATGP
jgi:3-oxoacyl-(acyl-carrier-protein) synthase